MTYALTAKLRYKACIHEAGHAVVHALGGTGVYSVEVAPVGSTDWVTQGRKGGELTDLWGVCRTSDLSAVMFMRWNNDNECFDTYKQGFNEYLRKLDGFNRGSAKEIRRMVRAYICGCLAGPIADQIAGGCAQGDLFLEPIDFTAGDDRCRAIGFCDLLPQRSDKAYYHLAEETESALREPELWQSVLQIANALQAAGLLDPDGHPNSPTFGHFKIPHPDEHVTVQ